MQKVQKAFTMLKGIGCAALCIVAGLLAAFDAHCAVTPVVEWNGDFSRAVQGPFSLELGRGNVLSPDRKSITLGGIEPVTVAMDVLGDEGVTTVVGIQLAEGGDEGCLIGLEATNVTWRAYNAYIDMSHVGGQFAASWWATNRKSGSNFPKIKAPSDWKTRRHVVAASFAAHDDAELYVDGHLLGRYNGLRFSDTLFKHIYVGGRPPSAEQKGGSLKGARITYLAVYSNRLADEADVASACQAANRRPAPKWTTPKMVRDRPLYHYAFNLNVNPSPDSKSSFDFGGEVPADSSHYEPTSSGSGLLSSDASPCCSPYGKNMIWPKGDWTISVKTRIPDIKGAVCFALGAFDAHGIALVSMGEGRVAIGSYEPRTAFKPLVTVYTPFAGLRARHYAISYSAKDGRTSLYLDGNLVGVAPCEAFSDSRFQFMGVFGGSAEVGLRRVDGVMIDDWRIYERAFAPDEIAALARENHSWAKPQDSGSGVTGPDALWYHYAFDGDLEPDPAATHRLKLEGVRPVGDKDFTKTANGAAIVVDITPDADCVPWSNDFEWPDGGWTITTEARIPDTRGAVAFSIGNMREYGIALASHGSGRVGPIFHMGNTPFVEVVSASVPDASSKFHKYAMAYDPVRGELAFYVDGRLKGVGPLENVTHSGLQFMALHGMAGEKRPSDMVGCDRVKGVMLDDWKMYSDCLSAEEIADLVSGPKPKQAASKPVAPPAPVKEEEKKGGFPVVPIIIAAVVIVAGAYFAWRKMTSLPEDVDDGKKSPTPKFSDVKDAGGNRSGTPADAKNGKPTPNPAAKKTEKPAVAPQDANAEKAAAQPAQKAVEKPAATVSDKNVQDASATVGAAVAGASSVPETPSTPPEAQPNPEDDRKHREEIAELARLQTRLTIKAEEAKTRHAAVDAFRTVPQGLESHIAEADRRWQSVLALKPPKSLDEAKKALAEIVDATDAIDCELAWLKTNKDARDDARRISAEIQRVTLAKVREMKADEIANALCAQAARECASGDAALRAGTFEAARKAYESSRETYQRALADTRRFHAATAVAVAKEYRVAGQWDKCLAEAEKALAWDINCSEAAALKADSEQHVAPGAKAVTIVNGREVPGARINVGGTEYPSPIQWNNLAKGAMLMASDAPVEFRDGDRIFRGVLKNCKIDWLGLKVIKVELVEDVGPQPGDMRTYELPGGVEMDFIYCAPGTFEMGSPIKESGRFDGETQHRVTISKGFWMGRYPVTQKQWKSVMPRNPAKFQGDNRPVENVSWDDCHTFMRKLKKLKSLTLALPTEAQWEYACRAGTVTAFSFGDSLNGTEANCNGKFPCGTKDKGPYLQQTSDVGTFGPNPWGICDMHGNVYEWCEDYFGPYPESSVTDPKGPTTGTTRVIRGGSWFYYPRYCRSAGRQGLVSGIRYDVGFRAVINEE